MHAAARAPAAVASVLATQKQLKSMIWVTAFRNTGARTALLRLIQLWHWVGTVDTVMVANGDASGVIQRTSNAGAKLLAHRAQKLSVPLAVPGTALDTWVRLRSMKMECSFATLARNASARFQRLVGIVATATPRVNMMHNTMTTSRCFPKFC